MTENQLAEVTQELAGQVKTRLNYKFGAIVAAIIALAIVLTYVVIQVQNSRYDLCVAQNRRHDRTIAYIERVAKADARHLSPTKRAALRVVVAQDKILIQDLAPHLNCTTQ